MRELIKGVVTEAIRAHLAHMIRYAMVGAFNTSLDFAVYLVLTRHLGWWPDHLVAAAVVSFCCGAVSSFVLNNFWTFRRDANGMRRRLPKFATVTAAGLLLNSLFLTLLLWAGLHDILAKLLVTGIVMLWNFSLHRMWTFRH